MESKLAVLGGTPIRKAAFPSWPVFDGGEERALLDVLHSGRWWTGKQAFGHPTGVSEASRVSEFESAFAAYHHAQFGIACSTGTAALEVALKAGGIGPGDEVIVPPYTFLASASAPLLLGAVPVFCDIGPDTYNLDPACIEAAITPYTRAIVPVHFAGLAADINAIVAIGKKHNLFVLEDAAHAHGASIDGHRLGAIGHAGIFSFQASKNMTAGEGGAIVTNDLALAALCNSYIWGGREIGRPWYEHHRLGWNHRITEFQAAILTEQLKRLPEQNAIRMQNGLRLNSLLREIPGVAPLAAPASATEHGFHIYILRFDSETFGLPRATFLEALEQEGIPCSSGYAQPLYRNPMFLENNFYANGTPITPRGFIDYASYAERCPVAERACAEAVWIEQRVLLADPAAVEDVARAIEKIYLQRHELGALAALQMADSAH